MKGKRKKKEIYSVRYRVLGWFFIVSDNFNTITSDLYKPIFIVIYIAYIKPAQMGCKSSRLLYSSAYEALKEEKETSKIYTTLLYIRV